MSAIVESMNFHNILKKDVSGFWKIFLFQYLRNVQVNFSDSPPDIFPPFSGHLLGPTTWFQCLFCKFGKACKGNSSIFIKLQGKFKYIHKTAREIQVYS